MVNISVPVITYLVYLRLKALMFSLDLIFAGREFQNNIDNDKTSLPPSVFLLFLGSVV